MFALSFCIAIVQPTSSVANATVTVRVLNAVLISAETWRAQAPARRRVVVKKDADGRPLEVRVVEFE